MLSKTILKAPFTQPYDAELKTSIFHTKKIIEQKPKSNKMNWSTETTATTKSNWKPQIASFSRRDYRPNVSGDEDDDGERTEPGISNGEEHVARDIGASEVPKREKHHACC